MNIPSFDENQIVKIPTLIIKKNRQIHKETNISKSQSIFYFK